MLRSKYMGSILAGIGAGMVTGLFGAGGGMVLIPLLSILTDVKEQEVFPASVSIILPICLVSLCFAAQSTPLPLRAALPYLIGSAAGGVIAGKWGHRIPVKWLHKALGILILWGGLRYLW